VFGLLKTWPVHQFNMVLELGGLKFKLNNIADSNKTEWVQREAVL
jgi:hypothetical protein